MSKDLSHTELIDNYILNRLSGPDKLLVDARMSIDSEFREQVEFQQSVINEIQNAKKAELKAMLASTYVPPVPQGLTVLNKALNVLSCVTIVAGIALNPTAPQIPQEEKPLNIELAELTASTLEVETASSPVAKPSIPIAKPVEIAMKEKTPEIVMPNSIVRPDRASEKVDDTIEISQAESSIRSEEASEKLNSRSGSGVSFNVQTIMSFKKKYRFENGNLILFGDFGRSPYEIIEYRKLGESHFLLYHDKAYYELNTDKREPTPLIPMKEELIREISEIRK
ncbi:hypothetical protein FUAX_20470 [Fulvitalea axinellae]|uniref:DUF4115 domain-containing protein n=1 Tax=Fulvitalea axinellae TaxID=1182444 RepID=A0AAU9DB85_9BACT|nr:hypothetical protein FUAX_20470 [Fulvitalea axinellae]